MRYWVSWRSGNYEDEGCTTPPFQFWNSGEMERENDEWKTDCSLCAVIDAPAEAVVWAAINKHFPDMRERFCERRADDWIPGDRFPGFENRTRIDAPAAPGGAA